MRLLRGELYEEFTMKIIIIVCLCIASALLFHQYGITSNDAVRTSLPELEDSFTPSADVLIRSKPAAEQIPSKEERLLMSKKDRIALLEKLGCVPKDPDYPSDYWLAERTSWYGKRLDPILFWGNRVVWLDDEASMEASRHGRIYPPMPYEDSSILDRNDVDTKGGYGALDSPSARLISSEREGTFWDKFQKTHPQPPKAIERWLSNNADSYLNIKHKLENDPEAVKRFRLEARNLRIYLELAQRDSKTFWYPSESVSAEAFHWDHVMRKRAEYEKFVASGNGKYSLEVKWFFNSVYVDKKLITEPLTDEDVKAANAWKIAYLRRLRTDKWEESYINAYLQAWDLKESEVFGDGNAAISR